MAARALRFQWPRGHALLIAAVPGLLAGIALAALPAASTVAGVRECTDARGVPVFTDRPCSDLGAVERQPGAAPDRPAARLHPGGCARNLQDLVFEVTSAIDSRDPNRLASVYHWAGMSGRTGYSILDRLDAIAQRPLVDILPVMPAAPDGLDGYYYPQASVRQQPIGLRVEQTLANGRTPSSTTFGLHQHLGCWWIKD